MDQRLISQLYEAHKNGQIEKQIEIAEKLNYFLLAGRIAKEHGLLKRAYENFKKINFREEMKKIEKIIYGPKSLNPYEIQIAEELHDRNLRIYPEIYEIRPENEIFYKPANDSLTKMLVKFQTQKNKFLPDLIKASN